MSVKKKSGKGSTIQSRRRFGNSPIDRCFGDDEVIDTHGEEHELIGASYIEDLRIEDLDDSVDAILSTIKDDDITRCEIKKIGDYCRRNSRHNDLIVYTLIETKVPRKIGMGVGEFFEKYFGWPGYTVSKMNKRVSILIALSSGKQEDWPDIKDAHLDELARVERKLGEETMIQCFNKIKENQSCNEFQEVSVPLISQTVEKLTLEKQLGDEERTYFKTANEEIKSSQTLESDVVEAQESANDLTIKYEMECLRIDQEMDALIVTLTDINQQLESKVDEIIVLNSWYIESMYS